MNKLLVLLAGVLLSTSSFAMSGSYGIGTDYMWRGQTQTDHAMAANFGLEQNIGEGWYVGNWNSTVELGGETELESDFYAGYHKEYGEFFVNAEYIAYRYSGEMGTNFDERIFQVGYNFFTYGKAMAVEDDKLEYEWYNLDLPFISWADVSLNYGEWEDGVKNKSLKIDWPLTDNLTVGLMAMDTVDDDGVSFTDAVSFNVQVTF
jgi:uncharacterized protein (TIGR02001 family)